RFAAGVFIAASDNEEIAAQPVEVGIVEFGISDFIAFGHGASKRRDVERLLLIRSGDGWTNERFRNVWRQSAPLRWLLGRLLCGFFLHRQWLECHRLQGLEHSVNDLQFAWLPH